jgi:hypothetical protein
VIPMPRTPTPKIMAEMAAFLSIQARDPGATSIASDGARGLTHMVLPVAGFPQKCHPTWLARLAGSGGHEYGRHGEHDIVGGQTGHFDGRLSTTTSEGPVTGGLKGGSPPPNPKIPPINGPFDPAAIPFIATCESQIGVIVMCPMQTSYPDPFFFQGREGFPVHRHIGAKTAACDGC